MKGTRSRLMIMQDPSSLHHPETAVAGQADHLVLHSPGLLSPGRRTSSLRVVDNSFGHKSFDVFIGNLTSYLNTKDTANKVPFLTPPVDQIENGVALPNYSKIANYQSSKDGTNSTLVVQHLQTIFFGVKDNAGNSKSFAITIYLDPTAPRVGGNANPTGSVNPSASMIALANQAYIIDYDTFQMISGTDPKKKV